MKAVIHLQSSDNLASIDRRMAQASEKEVLLVVPSDFELFYRPVSLKLVARTAQRLGKQVALVSRDRRVRAAAQTAGVSVFLAEQLASWGRWRRPDASLAAEWGAWSEPRSRRMLSGQQRRPRFGWLLAIPLLVMAFLFAGGLALALVPEATIDVRPAVRPVNTEFEMIADPRLEPGDNQTGRVRARVIDTTFIGKADTPTQAAKDVPDQPAKGEVTLVNRSNKPVLVQQGTLVTTSGGGVVRFQITKAVTVPAGGSAKTAIGAIDVGPRGNVAAGTINRIDRSLALAINVVNDNPTSGGTVKRVGTVTQADKDHVRELLTNKLKGEAAAALEQKLEAGEYLPEEGVTFDTGEEIYNVGVGETTDNLTLQMRVHAKGIAVPSRLTGGMALDALNKQVPKGFKLLSQTLQFQPVKVLDVNADSNQVRYQMKVWGQVQADFGTGAVIAAAQGKTVEQAIVALSSALPLDGDPAITVSPDWLGRVPLFPLRVHVDVGAPDLESQTGSVQTVQ